MRPRVRGWGRTRHTSSAARSCVHGGHSSARSSYPYTGGWEGYDLVDDMDPNLNHERLGWMKHKLESRLQGKISITSDTQKTPPLWQKAKRY